MGRKRPTETPYTQGLFFSLGHVERANVDAWGTSSGGRDSNVLPSRNGPRGKVVSQKLLRARQDVPRLEPAGREPVSSIYLDVRVQTARAAQSVGIFLLHTDVFRGLRATFVGPFWWLRSVAVKLSINTYLCRREVKRYLTTPAAVRYS